MKLLIVFLLLMLPLFGLAAKEVSSVPSSDSAANRLTTLLQSLQSVEGRYEQTLFDQKGIMLETTKGRFALKRPGYFFWKSEEPYPQTVVGNPKTLWVYDPDLEQVTVRQQDLSAAHNPARLLSNDISDLEKLFKISLNSQKNASVFSLIPLDKQSPFSRVSFRFEHESIKTLSFTDQLGQKTDLSLDVQRLNRPIDAALFDFIAPEGTDVLVDE